MNSTILKLQNDDIELPSERVNDFVKLARKVGTLVPDNEWDNHVWRVGSSFVLKGAKRWDGALAFCTKETTFGYRSKILSGGALAETFRDFAKAYISYKHATAPVTYANTRKRLECLRYIEAAFRSLGLEPRIEYLTVVVVNEAVALIKAGLTPSVQYMYAVTIQHIYRFCLEWKFLLAPFQWRHGLRKPKDRTEDIGEEAKRWREDKLPSPEAYLALAHIYRNSVSFIDRLYSALTAIFIAIPIRVHEVIQLRLDCEVYAKTVDPETGELISTYGIRVFPGKGNPPQVKWVPTQMVTVVQEAVARIREMCADARKLAEWYESHPNKLWLPHHLEKYRERDWLDIDDVPCLVTGMPKSDTGQWLRLQKIERRMDDKRKRSVRAVQLTSLAARLLPELPPDFPKLNGADNQLYSETLAVLFKNQVNRHKGTYRTIVDQVTTQSFSHWLTGHSGRPSVFVEWGFTERDGTPISITTHSFRHWLNTTAQLRGLSDLDIAKWSGRQIEQNQAYNHVTPWERLSQIRAALDDGKGIGPMFEPGKMEGVNQPVDRLEFAQAQIGAALTTEVGICVHDYSLLPCQSHGDCLNCSESVFIKGDQRHREQIAKRLIITQKQLEDARNAMDMQYYGADRWVRSHEASILKMKEMLAVHENTLIENGTVVSITSGSKDNEIAMALRDHQVKKTEQPDTGHRVKNDLPDDLLNDIWAD
ncbi:hypothetical protein HWX16_12990 [Ochrobactrum intermedium]|uniref:hypothetical protein n=1 Tax=Brucella intermedia TaxID=94625 RepID=UPI00159C6382|nr:hypothetical protein [Brucella intermedia]NVM41243.1 hypothetical protein [Brucella intermedia]